MILRCFYFFAALPCGCHFAAAAADSYATAIYADDAADAMSYGTQLMLLLTLFMLLRYLMRFARPRYAITRHAR